MNIHKEFTDLLKKFKTEKTKIETYISENKLPSEELKYCSIQLTKIEACIIFLETSIKLLISNGVIEKKHKSQH